MKISEKWLREWVNPRLGTRQLAEHLTMAGLEVGAIEPVAPVLDHVVVGHILSITPHPSAERLTVCEVNVGEHMSRTIVCGAANATVGLKAPVALPGAKLPNDKNIVATEIRGVKSSGMLCSAMDLGLEEFSEGLLMLESSAKPGTSLERLLSLNDKTLEIDLTPNRGDCLSIAGIAREVAALTNTELKGPRLRRVAAKTRRQIKVVLEAPRDCPCYIGRVIENIDSHAITPLWMKERLRRSGMRSVHPVVDITNYVQLELGQPMHAFDLDKLAGNVHVRYARKGESLMLLDGNRATLEKGNLLIADDRRPLAIAGIMGGLESAVSDTTQSVFLESAHFRPDAIAGRARALGLQTESAQRFERGVDPTLPRLAMERATELLLAIAGGKPGPITEQKSQRHLPKTEAIALRSNRIRRLLGISVPAAQIAKILTRLGMKPKRAADGWRVVPPSYRFDIRREADLIEDLARVYGYEKIIPTRPRMEMRARALPETRLATSRLRTALVDRDYQEVITYSFVDPDLQKLLDPAARPLALANPIAANMSVMRASLWPGLVQTLLYNQNRQAERQRLFEVGRRFLSTGADISQEYMLSGAMTGAVGVPQWGMERREVDFFDAKADVEALLALTGKAGEYRFQSASRPALHPGMTAEILSKGNRVGWVGGLHPGIREKLDLNSPVFLFELTCAVFEEAKTQIYREISRFPAIRRDIAVTVEASLPAAEILECVKNVAGNLLINLELFDEYHGKGIDSGRKSFAMGLTLQESSRTLKDSEVDAVMAKVVIALETVFKAKLRQ
ncbi:MAG: phenylalanine--tRNA ligase subunit beta [Gammaproteobacteria bacterium]|nr:phenylalanine--tRNA ligase subunit beta [Gammaproteobacteria bacterium]